jgi:hypothetical protein
MSKNSSDVPRSALSRALMACRDEAIALAGRALNVAANQRSRQQSRHGAFIRATAARVDSSDELALAVWDDDGGHSGTSGVDERYNASRRGDARAQANAISRCSGRARGPRARIDDSLLAPARDCELEVCGAVQQETQCELTRCLEDLAQPLSAVERSLQRSDRGLKSSV